MILHGILGAGRNWRTFARRWTEARPAWRVRLVDLRCHGESVGAPPPHTVAACAADVARLGPVEVVVGHSFGGKVALALAANPPAGLRQVWALDVPPAGETRVDTASVLAAIQTVPQPAPSRDAVRQQLAARDIPARTVSWLLTSLVRAEPGTQQTGAGPRRDPAGGRAHGWVWRLDLRGVEALLLDFRKQDMWPVVERPPVPLHLLRADAGDSWTADAWARAGSVVDPRLHIHTLADAGHWVQVDAPEALLDLVLGALRPISS